MASAIRHGLLPALLLVLSACKDDDTGPRVAALTGDAPSACVEAVRAAAAAPADRRLGLLAEGCGQACPALARFETDRPGAIAAMLTSCQVFCSHEARANWDATALYDRWSGLVADCGPAHLGLASEARALATPDWLVVHRLAGEATAEVLAAAGVDALELGLPVPSAVPRHYQLPAGTGWPVRAGAVIVLGADGLRAGPMPRARLGRQGLRVVGTFPPPAVEPPALPRRLAEVAGMSTARGDRPPPLLLADVRLPAADLTAALLTMQEPVRLGVIASQAPAVASAHRVTLVAAEGPPPRGAWQLAIDGADVTVTIPQAIGSTRKVIPARDGVRDLAAAAGVLGAMPSGETLVVVLGDDARVVDVAGALDVAAAQSLEQVALHAER